MVGRVRDGVGDVYSMEVERSSSSWHFPLPRGECLFDGPLLFLFFFFSFPRYIT